MLVTQITSLRVEPGETLVRLLSMEPMISYLFGIGDGHTTTWASRADADLDSDGIADAVTLDFDGDGRRDDAMWDSDGDGIADVAALDLDDDAVPESHYRDSGRGVWELWTVPGERQAPGEPEPRGSPRSPEAENPANRSPEQRRDLDLDGDGTTDARAVGEMRGEAFVTRRLYIDLDGDGRFDQMLVDDDGDGRLDAAVGADDPGYRPSD